MRLNMKLLKVLTIIGTGLVLSGARSAPEQNCDPIPPVPCNADLCNLCYCIGPDTEAINAPVRPYTCNGDFTATIAGFYWNAHQEGLTYAIESEVDQSGSRVALIDAEYKNPNSKWDFGFKLGVGYNTTCDGWDLGILWTRYRGRAFSHDEIEETDNSVLLTLWSNFGNIQLISEDEAIFPDVPLIATDIETSWELNLNLIDLEIGREFWSGRRLTLRPFIGLRIGVIKQDFDIEESGGSFNVLEVIETDPIVEFIVQPFNNFIDMENNYKGVGIRGGLESTWHINCGWELYGNIALSLLYGRFEIEQKEENRLAVTPFTRDKILKTKDGFRASRLVTDFILGIQWSTMFCDCKYGITARAAWENHLFLNQNQLWNVTKSIIGDFFEYGNKFVRSRGDLDTQGWTLTILFNF